LTLSLMCSDCGMEVPGGAEAYQEKYAVVLRQSAGLVPRLVADPTFTEGEIAEIEAIIAQERDCGTSDYMTPIEADHPETGVAGDLVWEPSGTDGKIYHE